MNDGRIQLLERFDTAHARVAFLHKKHRIKKKGGIDETPNFYLDESWISQNNSDFIWHHSTMGDGLQVLTVKGGRIIMLHAGSMISQHGV